jgi:hypothetical protein
MALPKLGVKIMSGLKSLIDNPQLGEKDSILGG